MRRRSCTETSSSQCLGGLWHGAAFTFVVWGAIHGFGLVVERELRERYPGRLGRYATVLQWLATFHVVCLAWIFFRAETFGTAWELLGRMFTAWGDTDAITPLLLLVIAVASPAVLRRSFLRLQDSFSNWRRRSGSYAAGPSRIDVLGQKAFRPSSTPFLRGFVDMAMQDHETVAEPGPGPRRLAKRVLAIIAGAL